MRAFTLFIATLAITTVILFSFIPLINQWERDHNYPYGQMCNSIFTGWVDTCPK